MRQDFFQTGVPADKQKVFQLIFSILPPPHHLGKGVSLVLLGTGFSRISSAGLVSSGQITLL